MHISSSDHCRISFIRGHHQSEGIDMTANTKRTKAVAPVVLPGGFISQPDAFSDAPPALQNILKLLYRPIVREGVAALEFSTDAMVVDFSAVDAHSLDPNIVAADCDFVKNIALKH